MVGHAGWETVGPCRFGLSGGDCAESCKGTQSVGKPWMSWQMVVGCGLPGSAKLAAR